MAIAIWLALFATITTAPVFAEEDPFTPPPAIIKPVVKRPVKRGRKFHVVIDPGHGGADHGTTFQESATTTYTEKQLTLLLAMATAEQLRARGIQVTLTRTADTDLSLGPRTALANKLKADVFLSIHMNATQTPMVRDAEGIETYILNNTTDATSKNLARLENTVLGVDTKKESPEELDVALILRDLRLDANLPESKRLACIVQGQLVSATSAGNRGVRQALFHVLLGAEMPSILVEAGFLNNEKDRALILNSTTRRQMATALAHSIETFRDGRGSNTCLVH